MSSSASDSAKPTPAYMGWSTFGTFIGHLQEMGEALPDQVTKSVMSKVAFNVQGQLRGTLTFLGLTLGDDHRVTDKLRALTAQHGTSGWAAAVKANIVPAYESAIGDLNLEKATPEAVQRAFRAQFAAAGSTLDKAIRFMLFALETAAIPLSPLLAPGKRKSSGSAARRRSKKKPKGKDAEHPEEEKETPPGFLDFPIHIPGHPSGKLRLPEGLTEDDLALVDAYMAVVKAHIKRATETGSDAD